MTQGPRTPPRHVPTLTEVIPLSPAPVREQTPAPEVAPAPPPPGSGPTAGAVGAGQEEEITQRVLADLQRQIDLMLEYRLRETLTPALARVADQLIRDTRAELASTLRDVVSRAVAQELARLRSRG